MSAKPIFVATHPRACSTAFERVFMTRRDTLVCEHEPFGDAFYYGPERLSERFEKDPEAREQSGFSQTTYKDVFDRIEQDASQGRANPEALHYPYPLIHVRLNRPDHSASLAFIGQRSKARKTCRLTPAMTHKQDKRVFIKDMAYYLMPPVADGSDKPTTIAPSLLKEGNHHTTATTTTAPNGTRRSDVSETASSGNPTVVPLAILEKYHFAFLIRHPRRAIPSYYRCCVPPQSEVTGFHHYMPSEAGYAELARLFDFLRARKLVGPANARDGEQAAPGTGEVTITVLDADDLLDKPREVIEAFCRETGIDYHPDMLSWDDPENQRYVSGVFAKWNGFHNDAINSTKLSARTTAHKTLTVESENEEWRRKYGDEAAKVIRASVDENIPYYEYLKSFAIKV
ncbi:hypothetical protein SLS62_006591 [Diatrype stigma]|uniref:P-loop containing nucleoside triphosphate hydrolase protein n=1 Tax=Diatrype stigma TaxID=117547 RepID=A0AAN9YRJ7_9PEZI